MLQRREDLSANHKEEYWNSVEALHAGYLPS